MNQKTIPPVSMAAWPGKAVLLCLCFGLWLTGALWPLAVQAMFTDSPMEPTAGFTDPMRVTLRLSDDLSKLPLAGPARALPLTLDAQPVSMAGFADYFISSAADISPGKLLADRSVNWMPMQDGASYPLKAGQSLWLRFAVTETAQTERWFVQLPSPYVEIVRLFVRTSAGQWQPSVAGDTLATQDWTLPHRHAVLPLLGHDEPGTHIYLLEIRNPFGFQAPIQLVSESHLMHVEQRVALLMGIYFGLVALTIVLALILALFLRDRAFAYYAVATAALALMNAGFTGIGGLHLWPGWGAFNMLSNYILAPLAVACFLPFVAHAVSMPARSRLWMRVMWGLSVLCLVTIAAVVFNPDAVLRLGLTLGVMSMCALATLWALIWAIRREDRYAKWILIACLPLGLLALPPVLLNLQHGPWSMLAVHGPQIGHALQMPIILAALLLRSAESRGTLGRVRELARVDPNTGLLNRTVFDERLQQLIARSRRLHHQSGLLVMQVMNLDEIQENFGRQGVGDLMLGTGQRLGMVMREIDTVAHISDSQFGLLLEGPLTAKQIATIASKAVSRCLQPIDEDNPHFIPRLRLALAVIPQDGRSVNDLMGKVKIVLSMVAPGDTRLIFPLQE